MRRVSALLVVAIATLSACGGGGQVESTGGVSSPQIAAPSGGDPSVIPVIVSSRQAVGANRFVFSFLDPETNLPAAAPDRTAAVAFIAPGETQPGTATPATFVWAIEGERGDYVANVDFPTAGDWKAVFVTEAPGSPQEAIGVDFQVAETSSVVPIGGAAPASDTPVAADVGGDLARLSTDDEPDPSFYELSVADALAAKRPFVLAFATPAFCKSAQCGPTLDRIKAVAADAPDGVAFINVEPYALEFTDGRLQPALDANGQLQPVPSVTEWGILTEPWVFAVDGEGIVRGSFEGVVGEDELRASIAEISGS